MIPTLERSDRFRLALALGFFAVAGATNPSLDSGVGTVVATSFAVVGVYALARHARTISRKRLAILSIGLWCAFLVLSLAYLVGLETVAASTPGGRATTIALVDGVTWSMLLGAGGSTAFLGFRELGAQRGSESPEEQVLDQDLDL
ncbi:hypothetical protein ACFOZ7_20600 [Natribaculum luteum]|uniref:Phosphatidate cytidylyltransferase n=1 Tax=Natribaculum luteum TaxID=1586232 RepID=A0ABD5P581_9EURY|nr:hypothetical protein [Natribaculum luteum]